MRYLLAKVYSWWWHLTYGMWKGYRETTFQDGSTIWLASTDRDWDVVKYFYSNEKESPNAASNEQGKS